MNQQQLNVSKPDEQWIQEYGKQRYERLCDALAEYMEAEEGFELFKRDYLAAIKDLSEPLNKQLTVLDKMKTYHAW